MGQRTSRLPIQVIVPVPGASAGLLEQHLAAAKALYAAGTNAGRDGAAAAVAAALEFVLSAPDWQARGLHVPLAQLMRALDDLDDGKVVAMLKPAVFAARSPDGGAVQAIRAVAALTLDRLVTLGFPARAVAGEVARTLAQAGFAVGRGTDAGGKTVASWRYRLRRERAKGVERDIYEAFGRDMPGGDGGDPAAAKARYLAALRDLAAEWTAGEGTGGEITRPLKSKR